MIYVNKMDIMGADFYRVLDMVDERFKCNPVPIQLPIGSEDTFKGIVDLVEMDAEIYYDDLGKDVRREPIPDDMKELAEKYRAKLIEHVADQDDELMENTSTARNSPLRKSRELSVNQLSRIKWFR